MIPFGIHDLVIKQPTPDRTLVPCYVRGCGEVLTVPSRKKRGSYCPAHGIKCFARIVPTYAYLDASQNIIVDRFEFRTKLLGHPFKFESHRLGYERSEDALTWNVFKSIHSNGLLGVFVEQFVGFRPSTYPDLYLWGINMDSYQPWDLLIMARQRFESNLPVERPLTEPDIAIHVPGELILLIEAKFTSTNPFYGRGKRANAQSLTLDELVSIYQAKEVQSLDLPKAEEAVRIHYQLWRNLVFAEWMATMDSTSTQFQVLNLVCQESENQSLPEFCQLLQQPSLSPVKRIEWESIHAWARQRNLDPLDQYMEQKTSALKPAFATKTAGSECTAPQFGH